MGVGDTFHMAPVGVFFGDGEDADGAAKADARRGGRRPVLRRRGPRPQGLHRVRRVHDRLPARREEHPQRELPPPRREGGRRRPPHDDRRRRHRRLATAATRVATVPTDERRKGRAAALHGPAGRPRRRHLRHPDPAAPHEGPAACCRGISDRLGELTRTNSEALVGAQTDDRRYRKATGAPKVDFTRGVAITSSIHPDENTHIEPVRYGKGSNAMGGLSILQVPYADGSSRVAGLARQRGPPPAARRCARSPTAAGRSGPSSAWSCSPWTTR